MSLSPPPLRGVQPARLLRGNLGMALSDSALADGVCFVREHVTIDIHSHPGRFFMDRPEASTPFERLYAPPFATDAAGQMAAGGLAGVLYATVADCCLLDAGPRGLRTVRDYAPGEVMADYRRQLAAARRFMADARLMDAKDTDALTTAHQCGKTGCMLTVEGGDFIEDRLERVAQAHADGVRAITIVHYHSNLIGDPQTAAPRHGGLSALGRALVAEMNRTGILVDMAHASFDATAQAAETSTRPMVISHSNLDLRGSGHPRMISLEHARLVTAGGGLVGAIPAGFGQGSFADYIDTILHMAERLGVGHLAIGTDMDFTYRSVFGRYEDWPLIPAALLARGMHVHEVAAVMGENALRVLAAVAEDPAR